MTPQLGPLPPVAAQYPPPRPNPRNRAATKGSGLPRGLARGFTLLEVLVATAIMGIAVAGIMSGLAQSTRNAARLTQYDRATLLAQQKMNELLADDSLSRKNPIEAPFPPELTGGIPAGWRARVSPFDFVEGQLGPGGAVIDRIELEIWWMDGPTRRSFALDGYRRAILRPEDF